MKQLMSGFFHVNGSATVVATARRATSSPAADGSISDRPPSAAYISLAQPQLLRLSRSCRLANQAAAQAPCRLPRRSLCLDAACRKTFLATKIPEPYSRSVAAGAAARVGAPRGHLSSFQRGRWLMTGKAGARDPPEIEASAAVELHPRHSMTGDVAVAAARVREVSVGAPLAVTELSFDSLDSTQKWAERHLDELVYVHLLGAQQQQQQQQDIWGLGDRCLCITATQQTAGVGTRSGETGEERRWVSSAGNLHATYVLQWPLQHQPLLLHLPFVAALSVLRVLQQLGIEGAHIKWVNDVLVGNKKIAGVLCQNTNRAVSVAGAAGAATAGSAPENVVAAAGSAQRDALLVLVGIGINIAKHPRGPMTDCCYQGSTDVCEALQHQQLQQKLLQQQKQRQQLKECSAELHAKVQCPGASFPDKKEVRNRGGIEADPQAALYTQAGIWQRPEDRGQDTFRERVQGRVTQRGTDANATKYLV
ncbi:uncharacterized protein LOC113146911 [Cyclospora cayetanensis]|uniref:Uncharacterized protein LOC113146911 n=1 Tax=Cyclospora cayetanensis TaxID=88456 RepID=A0A6P6RVD6_9EIME|nr:uncharacterized protein LOC113146911 [Cyclospora cayetanensis]